MKKRKVGILTFSDGRTDVYESVLTMNVQFQANLKKRLGDTGEFEVLAGEIIGTPMSPEAKQKSWRRPASKQLSLTLPSGYSPASLL
jgi:hypothetical protein